MPKARLVKLPKAPRSPATMLPRARSPATRAPKPVPRVPMLMVKARMVMAVAVAVAVAAVAAVAVVKMVLKLAANARVNASRGPTARRVKTVRATMSPITV